MEKQRRKVHRSFTGIQSAAMIPASQYKKIIEVLPILCVDIILINQAGEYLLVKRNNEPLKGVWWIIGGRVLKGESMEQAAVRKVKEEVNLKVKDLDLTGYYEEIFNENPFGLKKTLHTVSIVFSGFINESGSHIKLDMQSSEWKFSKKFPERLIIKSFNGKILNFNKR